MNLDQELSAEQLARLFHEIYEDLAPAYGYRTREASAKPWVDVPEQNRALMIATCARVLARIHEFEPEIPAVNGLVEARRLFVSQVVAFFTSRSPDSGGWDIVDVTEGLDRTQVTYAIRGGFYTLGPTIKVGQVRLTLELLELEPEEA